MLKSTKLLFGLLSLAMACFVCSSVVAQDEAKTATAEVESVDAETPAEEASTSATEEVPHDAAGTEPGHEGDDHEEHVDLDPTHGNLSDPSYKVVDFRTDMAFFSAIVFLLLLAGLSAVAWKPIMVGLEKRERGISENIARAEKAASEASTRLAEYEGKLASAAEEAQRIVAEARKDAEAAGQKLIASAQEEAALQRDRAVADIEAAKRVALSELASQSTEVAMSLAQRVVGREVKAADHQGLIQDMLSNVPSKN